MEEKRGKWRGMRFLLGFEGRREIEMYCAIRDTLIAEKY